MPPIPPPLRVIADRAEKAGLERTYMWLRDDPDDMCIQIKLRSGRKHRIVDIFADEAERLAEYKFEDWILIDGYEAVLDPGRGEILAAVLIIMSDRTPLEDHRAITQSESLPSSEENRQRILQVQGTSPASGTSLEFPIRPRGTQIEFIDGVQNHVLRISNTAVTRHDDARNLLLEISSSLFFDLDVAHDITPILRTSVEASGPHHAGAFQNSAMSSAAPGFPAHQYPREPLGLYLHADAYRRGLSYQPLYAFLNYYQVIEYFFPKFAREGTIRQVRMAMNDPRFNSHSEQHIAKLIGIIDREQRNVNERDQLATALAGCCTADHLREFITANDERFAFFAKGKAITGVPNINLRAPELHQEVARRLYAIRCRIVHAKEAFDEAGPLLPFSAEAQELDYDIGLARFVAQQALIASSERMTL